ncbi:MAG: hypothetical protein KIT83_10185 [Bryobacterales bacterium]|nr:hypothetical protein [Bryobacterales bacterium]
MNVPTSHPVSESRRRADVYPVGVIGHNSVGRPRWRSGPNSGVAAVAGLDVAGHAAGQIERGRIYSLYVLLDRNGA